MPPRPRNAWILYRIDKVQEVKCRGGPPMPMADLSKAISQMWRDESPEVKQFYEAKADEAKRLHEILYPDYKYKPKSKAEKAKEKEEKRAQKQEARLSRAPGRRGRDRSSPYPLPTVAPTPSQIPVLPSSTSQLTLDSQIPHPIVAPIPFQPVYPCPFTYMPDPMYFSYMSGGRYPLFPGPSPPLSAMSSPTDSSTNVNLPAIPTDRPSSVASLPFSSQASPAESSESSSSLSSQPLPSPPLQSTEPQHLSDDLSQETQMIFPPVGVYDPNWTIPMPHQNYAPMDASSIQGPMMQQPFVTWPNDGFNALPQSDNVQSWLASICDIPPISPTQLFAQEGDVDVSVGLPDFDMDTFLKSLNQSSLGDSSSTQHDAIDPLEIVQAALPRSEDFPPVVDPVPDSPDITGRKASIFTQEMMRWFDFDGTGDAPADDELMQESPAPLDAPQHSQSMPILEHDSNGVEEAVVSPAIASYVPPVGAANASHRRAAGSWKPPVDTTPPKSAWRFPSQ